MTRVADLPVDVDGPESFRPRIRRRRLMAGLFRGLCLVVALVGVAGLAVLLGLVGWVGAAQVDWAFLTSFPSRLPEDAGILAAMAGSAWLLGFTALFSVPVGVGAAVYLEEFARENRVNTFIEVNIANLAGVPSVVYGILGLALFVRWLMLGRSVLAGALTMSLLILPIVIIASREAVRGVPNSVRQAAFALGASRWQTVWSHVLPEAAPGICTGVILSLSRAIGETAPLLVLGIPAFVAFVPQSPMDSFTVLPLQIFDWTTRPQRAFHDVAAGGILVLLAALLAMNAVAIYLRHRFERRH